VNFKNTPFLYPLVELSVCSILKYVASYPLFFDNFSNHFLFFPPQKTKFPKTGTDCATHVGPCKVLKKEDFRMNIVNYRNRNEENMEKVVRARLAAAVKMKNISDTKNVYSNVVRTDVYVKDTGVTCF